MNLEQLYAQISEAVKRLDFDRIWKGFLPLKFALYNEKECYFDGKYIEKTADFCANTAIEYHGEYIAIWNVEETLDIDVFASKMVHEMFHAFQEMQGWNCHAKEMEALYKYRYEVQNLCIKMHENELLLSLEDSFEISKYEELLTCRKYRSEKFPYEYQYEACVEEIEGTANYVEWMVLEQLNSEKSQALIGDMKNVMLQPEYFSPIRISSYYTGALMVSVALKANEYHMDTTERPYGLTILKNHVIKEELFDAGKISYPKVTDAIRQFDEETIAIIASALERNDIVLTGPLQMKSVNIYDARCKDNYITSRFFLMYVENNQDKVIRGNFVIKMRDEKIIDKVYRWPEKE